jgi:hypothetical protein
MRWLLLALLLHPGIVEAQPRNGERNHCRLPQRTNDSLGYRNRGTRCEGVFQSPFGFNTGFIHMLSLTRSVAPFDPNSRPRLSLHWEGASTASVNLTATALRDNLYYRMDSAVEPGSNGGFRWDGEVISALQLQPAELAIVASTEYVVDGFVDSLRLPVAVHVDGGRDAPTTYQVVMLVKEEPSQVYASLTPLGAGNRMGRPLLDHNRVAVERLYAPNIIRFTLPRPSNRGIHYLELTARLWNNTDVAAAYWVYLAP